MVTAVAFDAAPVAADELPSGVVLRFSGPGNARVRAGVVRALRDRVALVPMQRVDARARRMHARLNTAEGRASVAEAMDLDVIIGGEVRGQGARARVQLHVYGANGEEIATEAIERPATANGRRQVAETTQDAVARTVAAREEPVEEEEEIEEPAEALAPPPVRPRDAERRAELARAREREAEERRDDDREAV
jgi:hypothetical protein